MPGALDGYTVVDLTEGAAGAIASMFLSDHGARVVRVIDRHAKDMREGGFVIWDRAKSCVRLDLDAATPGVTAGNAATDALVRLLRGADVLIDDFSPGCRRQALVQPRWLRDLNPGLVPCSITAYGKRGPWKDEPAIDELVLARTGVLGGLPGFRSAPVHLVHPLPTVGAACLAALGVAGALYARERTGRARSVETSLMAGALLYHPKVSAQHLAQNQFQTHPSGSAPFYSVYQCGDGKWVQLGCVHERFISTAAELMGIGELIAEPRFGAGRMPATPQADEELRAALREVIATRSFTEWAADFEAGDVPFAEARLTEESLDDPQILHNRMSPTLDDPVLGPVRQMGVVLDLSETPGGISGPRERAGPLNTVPADWPVRAHTTQGDAADSQATDELAPPLTGTRVLEITNLIAGPTTGRLLADLGADVVKLEPLTGDISRPIGRTYFYSVNFNKRSVSIDTGSSAGKTIVQRIAAASDALVANLRPGATARMGITSETCPRLIQTHLTGYGWTGPYAKRPGIDPLAQAMMGMERAQGGAHNAPVFPAQLAPTDFTTGAIGALGTVLGLLVRARTGTVQHANSNLLNGGALLTSEWFSVHAARTARPLADSEQYGLSPFHRLFELSDGWIYVVADRDHQRAALCDLFGLELTPEDVSLVGDPELHPNETDFARRLAGALGQLDCTTCLARLKAAGIPAAPAEKPQGDVFLYHPHAESSGVVAQRTHPTAGRIRVGWCYVSFGQTQDPMGLPTPLLGEHTRDVLSEVGFTPDEVDRLYAAQTVKTERPGRR